MFRIVRSLLMLSVLTHSLVGWADWVHSATARNSIVNPTIVNLYWDANWDSNHPTMTREMIDTFTRSLVESTYFSGLAEYVGGASQTAVTFAGGFMAAGCPSHSIGPFSLPDLGPTAPDLISEPDLARLVTCQVNAGGLPSGANVIYNILVPAHTRETVPWFCTGVGYTAYHFHSRAQPFTAIFARASCLDPDGFVGLTSNLTHEMVEAITDPKVDRPGSIFFENADLCSGNDSQFLLTGAGVTADYWSNSSNGCIGVNAFSDKTMPSISLSGVSFRVHSSTLNDLEVTINGTGFGTLPATIATLPSTRNLPYISVTNASAPSGWTAGNALPRSDAITLKFRSWSPNMIVLDGFGGNFGTAGNTAHQGDSLKFVVCNPQSGHCGSEVTVAIPLAPSVTSLSPASGHARGRNQVTISGTGFTSNVDTRVFFGNQRATNVSVVNSRTIQADAPPGAPGSYVQVSVQNSLGRSTFSPSYSYCGPVIDQIDPVSGPAMGGTIVTIQGSCLRDVDQVNFNSMAASNLVMHSDQELIVESPPAECYGAPSTGTRFVVGVNAMELDPRDVVWSPDSATWSPDSPHSSFTYTGQFPDARCAPPGGLLRSPCLAHPDSCLKLNLRDQLLPDWIGPHAGMRQSFTDLDDYDWARAAIASVASQGIFPGIDAKRFSPDIAVTRAEYVVVLQALVRAPLPAHSIQFADVKSSAKEYAAAQALGNILDLHRDLSGRRVNFRPRQVVDRQSAAVGIVTLAIAAGRKRLLNSADATTVLTKVPDGGAIDELVKKHVATAIRAGFFHLPDGRFEPSQPLTRAQLALLIDQLQALFKK